MRISMLVLTLVLLGLNAARAQETDSARMVQIVTVDGNEFIGTILEENPESVQLKTDQFGTITIKRSNIKSIQPIKLSQMVAGQYWFENFQSTRYFFSPNGYGLKKGEAYYQNAWIFFNQFSVGVGKNFSIGGGFVPLFLLGGGPTPVWLTPKFSIPISKGKVNLAAGAMLGTVLGAEDDLEGESGGNGFGQLYGMLTLGNRDRNFNFGLGYGYSGGELASTPTITFSAMVRTGPRGYFITENYIIDAGDDVVTLLSFGGRRLVKRSGIDFGLIIPVAADMESLVAIPWLGLTVPLNK